MHTELISISQVASRASMLIASAPATYLSIGIILLLLVISIPVFLLLTGRKFSNICGLVPYSILVIITTVYFRVPFLAMAELNPDESQELAAALTLLHDPVYWRSVDLHTHGPLATYPLMLPHLFGMQIDYGSARLLGLAMLLSSTLLIFSMLRKSTANTIAVIAVLPLITFISLTDYWDFVGYNAEHPVIFAIVLAWYFTDKALLSENRPSAKYLFAAGVIVGCAPFVKVQCLPMLSAIIAGTFAIICFRSKSIKVGIRLASIYSLGCLTFASVLFICLRYFNLWDDFVVRFLYGQLNYVKEKTSVQKSAVFFETFDWVNLSAWYYFDLLILAMIVLSGSLIFFKVGRLFSPQRENAGKKTLFSVDMMQLSVFLLLTVMSLVAIYVPGRHFRHYFLLLVFPLAILTGKLFVMTYQSIDKSKSKRNCVLMFVLLTAFGQVCYKYILSSYNVLLLRNKLTYDLLVHNSSVFINPAKDARDKELMAAIKVYANPGEKMVLWGWANKYYIQSRLIIACRTSTIMLVVFNMYDRKPYYFNSFMKELKAAKAPVFLDALEPEQFGFLAKKSQFAFEQFPQLNKYIQDNYTCMQEISGMRIFVSKQRLNEIQNLPAQKGARIQALKQYGS